MRSNIVTEWNIQRLVSGYGQLGSTDPADRAKVGVIPRSAVPETVTEVDHVPYAHYTIAAPGLTPRLFEPSDAMTYELECIFSLVSSDWTGVIGVVMFAGTSGTDMRTLTLTVDTKAAFVATLATDLNTSSQVLIKTYSEAVNVGAVYEPIVPVLGAVDKTLYRVRVRRYQSRFIFAVDRKLPNENHYLHIRGTYELGNHVATQKMINVDSAIGECQINQAGAVVSTSVRYGYDAARAWPWRLSDIHREYKTAGWMSSAAEAAGAWVRNPVDLKEVFHKWKRFSRGNRHDATRLEAYGLNDMAEPEEAAAFTYDEKTNRIGNPLNTSTLVGFISPDKYDSYLLDVTITSLSNWQVDPVGLVIAHAVDPDGTAHTLTVMRCGYSPNLPTNPTKWYKEDAPMQVSVDYHTSKQITIAKGYYGLVYNGGFVPTIDNPYWDHPGGGAGSLDYGFDKFPAGTRVRIDRNGDIITITASQYNDTKLWPGAIIKIDLNSHPSLARFKGAHSYGFCSISQDLVSWDAVIRPGGWRRPFWMSELDAESNRAPRIRFNTNSFVDMEYMYGVPAYVNPNRKLPGVPENAIIPCRTYNARVKPYDVPHDLYVVGVDVARSDRMNMKLQPDAALVTSGNKVSINVMTRASNCTVQCAIYNKTGGLEKTISIPKGVQSGGDTVTYELEFAIQPHNICIPYIIAPGGLGDTSIIMEAFGSGQPPYPVLPKAKEQKYKEVRMPIHNTLFKRNRVPLNASETGVDNIMPDEKEMDGSFLGGAGSGMMMPVVKIRWYLDWTAGVGSPFNGARMPKLTIHCSYATDDNKDTFTINDAGIEEDSGIFAIYYGEVSAIFSTGGLAKLPTMNAMLTDGTIGESLEGLAYYYDYEIYTEGFVTTFVPIED